MRASDDSHVFDIAIVGIAARLPGARDFREFWDNLSCGRECIRFFSEEELVRRGVSTAMRNDPGFVNARPCIDDIDKFAATFFACSPREAALMDPQHRLFLECAWQALEDAGYPPRHVAGRVGVFACCGMNTYLLQNIAKSREVDDPFRVLIANDKDFLATRVSYKLNLTGPSITAQTGCSSALTAVCLAVQSLLTFQCDCALAGGAALQVPQNTGYLFEKGGIASPDGHCRPFSRDANGTIFGDGVGAIVLKRLADAQRDRDAIYACIRSAAINNDGSAKAGYTAPSVKGQVDAILGALSLARLSAEAISYVEAHGTATELGDAAELSALTQAFRQTTDRNLFCALGSVKGNVGHLDVVAGIVGLIKTALMLKFRQLVPSINCAQATQSSALDGTPFYVNTTTATWSHESEILRAGVSSFGIGGTNVHLILEEAPALQLQGCDNSVQIIPVSAEIPASLSVISTKMGDHLRTTSAPLGDIAYTLQLGREALRYRTAVIARESSEAADALMTQDASTTFSGVASRNVRLCFMYPGGGGQHFHMGRELYHQVKVYKEVFDECAEIVLNRFGIDLRKYTFCATNGVAAAADLAKPEIGLPALFATEYALTEYVRSIGVHPTAMVGHSVGEYVAACVAGVFSVSDAIRLVALRGQLFGKLPTGGMIAVSLSEDAIKGKRWSDLSIAAINGKANCVLSGTPEAIARCIRDLERDDVDYRQLHIDVAAHSGMVEQIIEPYREALLSIRMRPPALPFVSNVTGRYITPDEACDPEYWCRQLRATVRFADCIDTLREDNNAVFVEMGPGRGLSSLIAANAMTEKKNVIRTMPHPQEQSDQLRVLAAALAQMWTLGIPIDWREYQKGRERHRVSLPAYPFEAEGTRHWILPCNGPAEIASGALDSLDCYIPSWKKTGPVYAREDEKDAIWVIIGGPLGLIRNLKREIWRLEPRLVIEMRAPGPEQAMPPSDETPSFIVQDLQALASLLDSHRDQKINLLNLVNVGPEGFEEATCPLEKLMSLAKVVMDRKQYVNIINICQLSVDVSGSEVINLERSLLPSASKVISQELKNTACKSIDIDAQCIGDTLGNLYRQLVAECTLQGGDSIVAYRGTQRWVRCFERLNLEPLPKPAASFKPGVYILLGGLGKLGRILAHSLASPGTTLVFGSRHALEMAQDGLQGPLHATHASDAFLSGLDASGCNVLTYPLDVADEEQVRRVFADVEKRCGSITGVFHLAGVTGESALRLVTDSTGDDLRSQRYAKIGGCKVLQKVLADHSSDFCTLFSSTATCFGGIGLFAYAAANSFLDTCAAHQRNTRTIWQSINWDGWVEAGQFTVLQRATRLDEDSIPSTEAIRTLQTLISKGIGGQVLVSKREPQLRMASGPPESDIYVKDEHNLRGSETVSASYAVPKTRLERELASIWAEVLGREAVGVRDNLFDLGADSLIALRILSKMRTKLKTDLGVTALFEAPTIETLAEFISGQSVDQGLRSNRGRDRGRIRREKRAHKALEI